MSIRPASGNADRDGVESATEYVVFGIPRVKCAGLADAWLLVVYVSWGSWYIGTTKTCDAAPPR